MVIGDEVVCCPILPQPPCAEALPTLSGIGWVVLCVPPGSQHRMPPRLLVAAVPVTGVYLCICMYASLCRARTLEAGQRWARLAQARAASRPGLCAIAPGRAQGVSGPSSSCVWNPRVFADDARGWQCPFVLCLHPQGATVGAARMRGRPGAGPGEGLGPGADAGPMLFTKVKSA